MGKPLSGGFPESTVGKESTCNVGDLGLISGVERSPGEQKGYPLQYSGLENSMDCIVHGVTKSQTRLSDSLSLEGQGCRDHPASQSQLLIHGVLSGGWSCST